MRSVAHAATTHGRRYMVQLAKHWGHKFEVEFDEAQARIVLPAGELRMEAGAEALDLVLEADEAEVLDRLEGVVARHLERFSFREPDLKLEWRPC